MTSEIKPLQNIFSLAKLMNFQNCNCSVSQEDFHQLITIFLPVFFCFVFLLKLNIRVKNSHFNYVVGLGFVGF